LNDGRRLWEACVTARQLHGEGPQRSSEDPERGHPEKADCRREAHAGVQQGMRAVRYSLMDTASECWSLRVQAWSGVRVASMGQASAGEQ